LPATSWPRARPRRGRRASGARRWSIDGILSSRGPWPVCTWLRCTLARSAARTTCPLLLRPKARRQKEGSLGKRHSPAVQWLVRSNSERLALAGRAKALSHTAVPGRSAFSEDSALGSLAWSRNAEFRAQSGLGWRGCASCGSTCSQLGARASLQGAAVRRPSRVRAYSRLRTPIFSFFFTFEILKFESHPGGKRKRTSLTC
jgi:hypothetical protein